MDLTNIAIAKALSGGSSKSPFTVLEIDHSTESQGTPPGFDDATPPTISSISWEDLLAKAVTTNSITGKKYANIYNRFVVNRINHADGQHQYGGVWHCVNIDPYETTGDVTMLYFASLTGGVYPTQDRNDHEQKWKAWQFRIGAPQTDGGRPVSYGVSSVGPNNLS